MRRAVVYTHRRPEETRAALDKLLAAAQDVDVELRFSPEETRKHGLTARDGVVVDAQDNVEGIGLVFVLGGDGTILTALRRYAGTGVPIFAVNFGEIGFLATVEPDGLEEAFVRAYRREYELLRLPAITLEAPAGIQAAINDVSIHRRVGERVAMLAYALEREEVGSVRCDGLVVATPAGSTGYNLANGGPVLAWGVVIHNRSREEPVDISVDGRPAGELGPGEALSCRFLAEAALLAQLPGSNFYQRLREKFGKLV